MTEPERLVDCSTTSNHSQEPAFVDDNDNFSTQTQYKKIFSNEKCRCPFGCYICGKMLGGDLVEDVYKRDWILIENDKAVFWSMFEKGGFD
jgi:hypothetical protein